MTSNLHRIEPLTGANYSTWKIKLRWILINQDLWGYVTGVNKRPELADMNAITAAEWQEMIEWDQKDQQAYVAICLWISNDYIIYTYNMTTSKGIWDALV